MKFSNLVIMATVAMVGVSAYAGSITCTANENGNAVSVMDAAIADVGTQDISADHSAYAYEAKVCDGKLLYVAATDNATGTRYQSTSVTEKSYYLDLQVTEKGGKVLVFQCSMN
jgi:hypothetical protein